jgi:pyruvate-formate lyase
MRFTIEPPGSNIGYEVDSERMPTELRQIWERRITKVKARTAFSPFVAQTLPSDDWQGEKADAFPLYRLAGITIDHATGLSLGLPGLIQQADGKQGWVGASGLVFEAIQKIAKWYGEGDSETAATCRAVASKAPSTMAEAIQLILLLVRATGAWNYGRLDVALGSFLKHDLDQGRLTEETAVDLLVDFWKAISRHDNHFNNRVILGGLGRSDPKASDAFALLALKATARFGEKQPQVSVRLSDVESDPLWEPSLDCLATGSPFPILYNDPEIIPAVQSVYGVSFEEACQWIPYGCGEISLEARTASSPNAVINLAFVFAQCLEEVHPSSRDLEALWRSYEARVELLANATGEAQSTIYEILGKDAPCLLASSLNVTARERGLPLLEGGALKVFAVTETYGNTNVADSFAALEHWLNEDSSFCLGNWREKETAGCPAFGNNDDRSNFWMSRVHNQVCTSVLESGKNLAVGGHAIVWINNNANNVLGALTPATPDGRKEGERLANGNNPHPGRDRSGLTALLQSLGLISGANHLGVVQNLKVSPDLLTKHRAALRAALEVYFLGGGTQIMFTVIDQEELLRAMDHPEEYPHLLVRVGGFSARFVELPREVQEEIVARTAYGQ